MKTPICDFVSRYAALSPLRLHMPGHKGEKFLGAENLDITEIDGADSLYEASGIIRQSEENAGKLFGCDTFYSTEGSSHCIRAMLYLALTHGTRCCKNGARPLIVAGRNAHKTFLSAAALLDFDVLWLYPKQNESYLSCQITAADLAEVLENAPIQPTAVYLTTPDYLGNCLQLSEIAAVCHAHGVLLLVDNAHGAYLRFLPQSAHPIDEGADMCCDSAHKTLPVLTGGAYLHISPRAAAKFSSHVKQALSLFGSTSPSYLILQSLDYANLYLEKYPEHLANFLPEIQELKQSLAARGYNCVGNEPLKICLAAKSYGYTGSELAALLAERGIFVEFSDVDFLVMMFTPEVGDSALERVREALCTVPKRTALTLRPPVFGRLECVLTVREAMFAPSEILPVKQCAGRILAEANVGCPPAVPLAVCGERIDDTVLKGFQYYGIETCVCVCE